MKVTYNWLKDFIEIKIPAHALADKLTMSGQEVKNIEEKEGDFVFEIEVTSNRPDCLSVIGVAREVAAITNSKLKSKKEKTQFKDYCMPDRRKNEKIDLKIEIENKKDCPLYTVKVIRGVKVGPSPDWMKRRLELIGCRSVNNIVDATNYIMFTYGEPLHAFDMDKLEGQEISVRRAGKAEKLITIDSQELSLDPEILVIADRSRPIALAGIMGGKDTEVSESTKNILLEAAIFQPVLVRHGRQKLALMSESAYRFERGIDILAPDIASGLAEGLIRKISSGECVLAKSKGGFKIKKKTIKLDVSGAREVLGVPISSSRIKSILENLDFRVEVNPKNSLSVFAPSYRQDISLEVDLIEEIARISGYESIPKTIPRIKPTLSMGRGTNLPALTKETLAALGLNEVITYSLIDKGLLNIFKPCPDLQAINILNPLSKEQEILRVSLIPSLAACVAYNLNQKQESVGIFEVAKIFKSSGENCIEEIALGIGVCGNVAVALSQGLAKEALGFLHLKGIIEALFEKLGIKEFYFQNDLTCARVGIYLKVPKEESLQVGAIIRLDEQARNSLGVKNKEIFMAELLLERIFTLAKIEKHFLPTPKYPAINRDISFVIKEENLIGQILEILKGKGKPLISSIEITDYYKGKQIPEGSIGLTISCLYRSEERTLTEDEINPLHALVCQELTDRFKANIR